MPTREHVASLKAICCIYRTDRLTEARVSNDGTRRQSFRTWSARLGRRRDRSVAAATKKYQKNERTPNSTQKALAAIERCREFYNCTVT